MIPRYTPEDIGAIWSEASKIESWLQVEVAACEAMAESGLIPKEDLQAIKEGQETADFDALATRAEEIEKTTKHDVIAFLTAFEEIVGEPSRHIHFGLTSSDILDTSFSLRLLRANQIVKAELSMLLNTLSQRVREHADTPCMGRSHGIHAEPMSFGIKLLGYHQELTRSQERLLAAERAISVGKLSGAVGSNAHFSSALEKAALEKLGLEPELVATQVVPRDRYAEYFVSLAMLAAGLERLSVEVRHLQRTEVREVEEPFSVGQKGSSAMPHKRNPILTENVTGLSRLLRSYAQATLENIVLWHERDISHSSVERMVAPDATIAMVFMLRRMRRVVDGLVVYPEKMIANIELMRGLVFSQAVLLKLAEAGLKRQEAYEMVQRAAMRVWDEGIDLLTALNQNGEVSAHLSKTELERCFDLRVHLRSASDKIEQALGPA